MLTSRLPRPHTAAAALLAALFACMASTPAHASHKQDGPHPAKPIAFTSLAVEPVDHSGAVTLTMEATAPKHARVRFASQDGNDWTAFRPFKRTMRFHNPAPKPGFKRGVYAQICPPHNLDGCQTLYAKYVTPADWKLEAAQLWWVNPNGSSLRADLTVTEPTRTITSTGGDGSRYRVSLLQAGYQWLNFQPFGAATFAVQPAASTTFTVQVCRADNMSDCQLRAQLRAHCGPGPVLPECGPRWSGREPRAVPAVS